MADEDPPPDRTRVIKASLAAHLHAPGTDTAKAIQVRIEHAVQVQHWLSVHTMHIVKLWCVLRASNNRARDLPVFNTQLVADIMAKLYSGGSGKALRAHDDFEGVLAAYWDTIPVAARARLRDADNAPIKNVCNADAGRIVTTLETNILNTFAKCVRRFCKTVVAREPPEPESAWKHRAGKMTDGILDVLWDRKTPGGVGADLTEPSHVCTWAQVVAHLPHLSPVPKPKHVGKADAPHVFLSAATAQQFLPAMMYMCHAIDAARPAREGVAAGAGAGEESGAGAGAQAPARPGVRTQKPLAVFPMRTSMVPAYITLDYSALVDLCYDMLPTHVPARSKNGWTHPPNGIVQYQDELWGALFETSHRMLRDGADGTWRRGDSIQTDGIGLSAVRTTKARRAGKRPRATPAEMAARQEAKDKAEQAREQARLLAKSAKEKSKKRGRGDDDAPPAPPKKRNRRAASAAPDPVAVEAAPVRSPADELYVTDLTAAERTALDGRRVIGIDPGKSDLIFATALKAPTEPGAPIRKSNLVTFRYTQASRKTVTAKIDARRKEFLRTSDVALAEATLNDVHQTSLEPRALFAYFRRKNAVNEAVAPVYMSTRLRKWRLSSYIAIQANEARMMRAFEKKFGSRDTLLLAYGNWSATETFRGQVPTRGAGLRRLFARMGFKVLLVQEFYTSKRCCACKDGECSTFRHVAKGVPKKKRRRKRRRRPGLAYKGSSVAAVDKPRPSGVTADGPTRVAHGLVRCNNTFCARLWNRDVNGSVNILLVALAALAGEDRPPHLTRAWQRVSAVKVFRENAGDRQTRVVPVAVNGEGPHRGETGQTDIV